MAINESNIIVGESDTSSGRHAVRFELDGSITDLGTLGGDWSRATDINENGDIVGQSKNAEGNWRAFVIHAGKSMVDLGTLGGKESSAVRINNKGQIVGSAQTADGDSHAYLWSAGTMTDLGTFEGGTYSAALGINDHGVVVGTSNAKSSSYRAFVWYCEGPIRNLGPIVISSGDDYAYTAKDINNNGVIVAGVFHPVYRTGVEFPTVFRPGTVKSSVSGSQWQITIGAPPGYEALLDSSQDFQTWTTGLATTVQGEESTHSEPIENGSRFFRVSLKAQAQP